MLTFPSRPFLFLVTVFATFVVMMGESNIPQYLKYTTVSGFFQQDDPATEPKGFDYVNILSLMVEHELMLSDQDKLWLDRASLRHRC
jgi:hypothetical protein